MAKRMHRYGRLFGRARGLLAVSLVVSVAQSALLMPVPLVLRHVFDVGLRRGHADDIAIDGAAVLGLYLASAALGLWTRFAVLKATKRAIAGLRSVMMEKMYMLPRAFFDRQDAAALHATIVQDSERLDIVANAVVGLMLPAVVVALGLSVVAVVLDPLLAAILACALPPMVVLSRWMAGRVRARTRTWQEAFDAFSAHTQVALRARMLTEVSGAEAVELDRSRRRHEELSAAGLEMAWRQSAWGSLQGAIVAAAAVLVLVIGGRAVADRQMSVGDLLSFYAIVVLLQGQVSTIVALLPLAVSGEESLERLDAILDLDEPAPYRGRRKLAFAGAIELVGVTFGYGTVHPLLTDVHLGIRAGEHLVIAGDNGAGKSTLASLILGLYRPWCGEVRADGVGYHELDLPGLRRQFGVVLQDPLILPTTVAENIAYGRPEAGPEEIRRAAELSGAAAFVEQLRDGYRTRVGDDGALLSGGQRQRLAIARALVGRPRLLILDEPTTHLDRDAIAALQEALNALTWRPSVLLISHDDALIAGAERVVTLENGRLAPGRGSGRRSAEAVIP